MCCSSRTFSTTWLSRTAFPVRTAAAVCVMVGSVWGGWGSGAFDGDGRGVDRFGYRVDLRLGEGTAREAHA